jgi:small-conductance mechanosensitive channel
MIDFFADLITDWSIVIVPAAVFAFSLIALFWLRRLGMSYLYKRMKSSRQSEYAVAINVFRIPTAIFCVILSCYLGITVSNLARDLKVVTGNILWTLFIIAVAIIFMTVLRDVVNHYGNKFNTPERGLQVTRNIMRGIIMVIGVLIILDIWNIPTSSILLLAAVLLIISILILRNIIPNLLGAFQLSATHDIEIGDYIKIETGEEGIVQEINWRNTQLKAIDGNLIYVPNNTLIGKKIINRGHPVKKASQPFLFNTRTKITELTGLKARNLTELADILKEMPDQVIYHHTHQYLEEYQYLIPELSNDFASWVRNSMGNDMLAESLASINILDFTSLPELRDAIVSTIEETIKTDQHQRQAMPGMEFYFMKSVTTILPTKYAAYDLRHFVEALRRVGSGSIYFHMFDARLRLGKKLNDFSIWLEESMGEPELSKEISRIDPYSYTLEGLRSKIIQLVEKRII